MQQNQHLSTDVHNYFSPIILTCGRLDSFLADTNYSSAIPLPLIVFEAKIELTAVRKDNKIIFFGGNNSARFDIYDLATNSWSIGVLQQILHSASIISYNNIMYLAGGYVNGVLSNQVWKLEF